MQSVGCSGAKHTATGLQSSGDIYSGVPNHVSPYGQVWVWWLPGERYLFDCIVQSVKFGGGEYGVGLFSRSWA